MKYRLKKFNDRFIQLNKAISSNQSSDAYNRKAFEWKKNHYRTYFNDKKVFFGRIYDIRAHSIYEYKAQPQQTST